MILNIKRLKTTSGLLISPLGLYPRETLLKLKKKKKRCCIPWEKVEKIRNSNACQVRLLQGDIRNN